MHSLQNYLAISLFFSIVSGLFSGCANLSENTKNQDETTQAVAEVLEPISKTPEQQKIEAIENLTIGEVIRLEEPNTANLYDNSRYDFPITVNARVEGWIDYFTGRGRPHMERYLGRSGRYIPGMKKVLKKNGLPEDLVYLALIESGFNLRAKSRARAVGPWQFMKATGKRYGLRVDAWIDERRDPIRSTEAAARYLKDLYLMFESWYLAASAYNAGEYKILRAIEEVKSHNFWRIGQTRAIRKETKDYVPKLIAAAIIAKNPTKYGFHNIEYDEPFEFDLVVTDFPIHLNELARVLDCSEEDLKDLNPELIREMVPVGVTSYEIRVPRGKKLVTERLIASLKNEFKVGSGDLPLQHTVKPGETLASVSKRYRVKVSELANVNNMSSKEKVSPGLSLIIPKKVLKAFAGRDKTSKEPASVSKEPVTTKGNYVVHTVRSGESLWSISEKYNVTVKEIFKWNQLKRSKIAPGQKIKVVPKKEDEALATEAKVIGSGRGVKG